MSSRDNHSTNVDMSNFRIESVKPAKGSSLSSKYASRSYPARYAYVQPIAPNGKPISWIRVGMAIASGILLLPVLLGTPLLIAIALGRHFPFAH